MNFDVHDKAQLGGWDCGYGEILIVHAIGRVRENNFGQYFEEVRGRDGQGDGSRDADALMILCCAHSDTHHEQV